MNTTTRDSPAWPPWATMIPSRIRTTLDPSQWGPWAHFGPCLMSAPGPDHQAARHPTDDPHFFHCADHLQQYRARNRVPTFAANTNRDQGLCSVCDTPAIIRTVTRVARVAAILAERAETTVARLQTHDLCASCSLNPPRRCQGTGCKNRTERNRVGGAGCCGLTVSRRRHCSNCCQLIRKPGSIPSTPSTPVPDQPNSQSSQNHGTQDHSTQAKQSPDAKRADSLAASRARLRTRRFRREKVATLFHQGLTDPQIAEQIGAPTNSIRWDLRQLNLHRTCQTPRPPADHPDEPGLPDTSHSAPGPSQGDQETQTQQPAIPDSDSSAKAPSRKAPPRKTPPELTRRRRRVAQLKRNGFSNTKISLEIGITIHSVRRDLDALRRLTQAARDARNNLNIQRNRIIANLTREGLSVAQISNRTGYTQPTVRRHQAIARTTLPDPPSRQDNPETA